MSLALASQCLQGDDKILDQQVGILVDNKERFWFEIAGNGEGNWYVVADALNTSSVLEVVRRAADALKIKDRHIWIETVLGWYHNALFIQFLQDCAPECVGPPVYL